MGAATWCTLSAIEAVVFANQCNGFIQSTTDRDWDDEGNNDMACCCCVFDDKVFDDEVFDDKVFDDWSIENPIGDKNIYLSVNY